MESPQPVSGTPTGGSGRVGRCCSSYDSIRQRSHHCRHQYQQRFWNKRRPGAIERRLLEKPTGQGRVGGVEIGWLFQCRLFYEVHQLSGRMALEPRLGTAPPGSSTVPDKRTWISSFSKTVALRGRLEKNSVQFRAEFFNTLNHPQFANPDANFTSPTFGVISSTAVNARVGQLALRYEF